MREMSCSCLWRVTRVRDGRRMTGSRSGEETITMPRHEIPMQGISPDPAVLGRLGDG